METDRNSDETREEEFRSGFAGIIGRPNVGKSTLLNSLVGRKVAITSEKPQTTRNVIRAIVTTENAQVIFLDTPGFHKPRQALGERLDAMVRKTFKEVDVIIFMLDGSTTIGKGDVFIANELGKVETPVVGVLGKIDLLELEEIESKIEIAKHLYPFERVIPVSAKYGKNLDELLEALISYLPPGPLYFPPDVVTDQPEEVLVAELIREKVLELTRDEVPHSVAVKAEIKPREESDIVDVEAVIYVERDSQKGIIIGKSGRLIKEIGSRARAEIEPLIGNHVFLDLRVKVEKNWSKNPDFIKRLGYEP